MIIITGTGRSGTSFVCQVLDELGMDFGPPEMLRNATPMNPRGYYENEEIVTMNRRLLLGERFIRDPRAEGKLDGRRWMSMREFPKAMYLLPSFGWLMKRRVARAKGEIEDITVRYAGMSVKDPRFSSTLGIWARHEAVERVLYCYRNPSDMATSFAREFHVPRWVGYSLWCKRVQESLRHLHGIETVIVKYDNFFDGSSACEEMQRLFRFAGREFSPLSKEDIFSRLLDRDARHYAKSNRAVPYRAKQWLDALEAFHAQYGEPKAFGSVALDLRYS